MDREQGRMARRNEASCNGSHSLSNHEHGTGSPVHNAMRHTTEEEPVQPPSPMGAGDHKVEGLGFFCDQHRWFPFENRTGCHKVWTLERFCTGLGRRLSLLEQRLCPRLKSRHLIWLDQSDG